MSVGIGTSVKRNLSELASDGTQRTNPGITPPKSTKPSKRPRKGPSPSEIAESAIHESCIGSTSKSLASIKEKLELASPLEELPIEVVQKICDAVGKGPPLRRTLVETPTITQNHTPMIFSGAGSGAGAGANDSEVLRRNQQDLQRSDALKQTDSNGYNAISRFYLKTRNKQINKLLSLIEKDPAYTEIKPFLESAKEAVTEINECNPTPKHVIDSKQFLLHHLMKELTPAKTLKDTYYNQGIHGITSIKQIKAAFDGLKKLEDETFLLCVQKLQRSVENFAPNLTSLEEIKAWMDNEENTSILDGVEEIDFSNMELQLLPRNLIPYFHKLHVLKITDNHLVTLPNRMLSRTPFLADLHLSNNEITHLRRETFEGLVFDETRDELLDVRALLGVDFSLFLANNQLSQLPCGIFKDIFFDNLYLSDNCFREIPCKVFEEIATIHGELSFSGNQLSSFTLTFNKYTLSNIDLSNNKFTEFPKTVLDPTYFEEEFTLDLSKNQIKSLDDDTVSKLHKIPFINLSDNKISFEERKNMEEVRVTTNTTNTYTTDLESSDATKSPSAEELNLSSNQINFIPRSLFRAFKRFDHVILSFNNAVNNEICLIQN